MDRRPQSIRRRPFFKTYPADRLADARLSACSLAAQGLAARLEWISRRAAEPGRLALKLHPVGRAVGVPVGELAPLIAELVDVGLLLVDGDSWRLPDVERDERDYRWAAENGLRGVEKRHPKGGTTGGARSTSSDPLTPQKSEVRSQKSEVRKNKNPAPATRGGTPSTRAWDEAWSKVKAGAYPWDKPDLVAIAAIGKFADATPAEITCRALRLLRSEVPWDVQHPTPRELRSQWARRAPAKAPEPAPAALPFVDIPISPLRTTQVAQ